MRFAVVDLWSTPFNQSYIGINSIRQATKQVKTHKCVCDCVCVHRVHARAGPLLSEASHGTCGVKCRIIAKAARELLRGSFANISVEAASLSEVLVGLVQNSVS